MEARRGLDEENRGPGFEARDCYPFFSLFLRFKLALQGAQEAKTTPMASPEQARKALRVGKVSRTRVCDRRALDYARKPRRPEGVSGQPLHKKTSDVG